MNPRPLLVCSIALLCAACPRGPAPVTPAADATSADALPEVDAGPEAHSGTDAGVDAGDAAPADGGITSAAPAIAGTALPVAVRDVFYRAEVSIAGGERPLVLSAIGLPSGMTIDHLAITGTPSLAGSYSLALTVDDAVDRTAHQTLQLIVVEPLSITTTALPGAREGAAYSQALVAAGGHAPYSWRISAGALPPGLALSGNLIEGTGTAAESASFTVEVTDSAGLNATAELSIEVLAALRVTTAALADALVGQPYSATIALSGGTPPYTWSAIGAPIGFGLHDDVPGDPEVTFAGTALAEGTFAVRIAAADAAGETTSATLPLIVGPPYTITPGALPAAAAGIAYEVWFGAQNGAAPHVFALTGSVPGGLTLEPSGRLHGAPLDSGAFTFEVSATDALGHVARRSFTLAVTNDLAIDSSGWSAAAEAGSPFTAQLTASGGLGAYTWMVTPALPAGLTLDAPGTGAVATIAGTPAIPGTFSLSISASDGDVTRTVTVPLEVVDPLRILTTSLPAARTRAAYTATIEATGTPSFELHSGSLPPGLTLSPGGQITGVTTAAGIHDFVVRATYSPTVERTAALSITVTTLGLATTVLPPVSTPYSAVISASGGVEPYFWAISAGSLPPGWTLAPGSSSATLAGSSISGVYTLTIEVTDQVGNTDARAYTLSVGTPADPVRALWPIPSYGRPASEFIVHTSTLTDLITGIEWTRDAVLAPTLAAATAHCASLSYGGYADWRVPTYIELVSIGDYPSLDIHPAVFNASPGDTLWTSTPAQAGQWSASGVRLISNWQGAFGALATFCVRAGLVPDQPRYQLVRGSSIDVYTGLMWSPGGAEVAQETDNGVGHYFCNHLSSAGFTDWRVPTVKELMSANGPGTLDYFGNGTDEFSGVDSNGDVGWEIGYQFCVRRPRTGCGTPIADMSATATIGAAGYTLRLDGTRSSGGGACAPQLTWSISPGTYVHTSADSTGSIVDIIPLAGGTITVTLSATVDGAQATDTRTITIAQPSGCTLWADVSASSSGFLSVTAYNGTPPYSYMYLNYFDGRTDPFNRYAWRDFHNTGFISSSTYSGGCGSTDEGVWFNIAVRDAAGCVTTSFASYDCGA